MQDIAPTPLVTKRRCLPLAVVGTSRCVVAVAQIATCCPTGGLETAARQGRPGRGGGEVQGVVAGEGGASVPLREAVLRVREGGLPGAGEEHTADRDTARLREPADRGPLRGRPTRARCGRRPPDGGRRRAILPFLSSRGRISPIRTMAVSLFSSPLAPAGTRDPAGASKTRLDQTFPKRAMLVAFPENLRFAQLPYGDGQLISLADDTQSNTGDRATLRKAASAIQGSANQSVRRTRINYRRQKCLIRTERNSSKQPLCWRFFFGAFARRTDSRLVGQRLSESNVPPTKILILWPKGHKK